MKKIASLILLPLHIPHLIIFFISKARNTIIEDLKRQYPGSGFKIIHLIVALTFIPEFRALYYYRIGKIKYLIKWLHPAFLNLYIYTPKIGEGLRIQHGFSTVIAAKRIGKNCWINQQVTIGYTNDNDCPTIHNNVVIGAGAIVVGDITISSNVLIGAGAVVTKSIPENSVVVGNPCKIINNNAKSIISKNYP